MRKSLKKGVFGTIYTQFKHKPRYGEINPKKSIDNKIVFESKMFRFVIATNHKGQKKQWLLSAFDLRPINKKTS